MELKIHRPSCRCAVSDRPITAGETFYSALVRGAGTIDRLDIAAEAWTTPPANTIAWWRSTMPAAAGKGPSLASPDVLLDVLERLEGSSEAPLRYLLALFLVRRRVLRIAERQPSETEGQGLLRLACPRRATEYLVRPAEPIRGGRGGDDPELQRRLEDLLWSGEAA